MPSKNFYKFLILNSYDSQLNVAGSSDDVWDKDDVSGSHDLYQKTMNKNALMAIAVTKWDSMRELRKIHYKHGRLCAKGEIEKIRRGRRIFLEKDF